ncbi:MAG: alpha-amylase family glycosyl hydrolase [Chitinophagales bacterium]
MKYLFAFLLWSTAIFAGKEPQGLTHVAWSNRATIYEVNVRQYSREGTLKAVEAQLPRLRAMGVDILWLMPIYPIGEVNRKGTLGSYYSVKDYRAVNPEFGTMDDLKHLVAEAHKKDMKVILDWVPNHSSFDNALITQHPDWYKHDSTGKIIPPVADWTDVAALDYANPALREYQIESMKYWLTNADVDGFRCDVAMMVPVDFWQQCRTALDAVKPVFMLAEAEGPEFHKNGFDMTYGWELHHLLNLIAKGEKQAADLDGYFEKNNAMYQKGDYRMYFTTNHDENSWNGTEFERMGDAARAMFVLCSTVPGMPLMYSGQEAGLNRRLKFFDKDPIDFTGLKDEVFFTKLFQLKHNNAALANGINGGDWVRMPSKKPGLYAFMRIKGGSKVVVVMNLSATEVKDVLAEKRMAGDYLELFSGDKVKLFESYNFSLKPWEYRVYVK